MKTFYVCSYGGSGSKMLCEYLNNFGNTKHIHSRKPPDKLTYIGTENNSEWFNTIQIPENKLEDYFVIYIYKNPIKSIYSRFTKTYDHWRLHLRNIQTDAATTLEDIIGQKKDLYGIEEFFDNYVIENPNRNYKIYCIKYEDFFGNISEFNKTLNIEDNENLYPKERTTKREYQYYEELENIYKGLLNKMNKMKFIEIIKNK